MSNIVIWALEHIWAPFWELSVAWKFYAVAVIYVIGVICLVEGLLIAFIAVAAACGFITILARMP